MHMRVQSDWMCGVCVHVVHASHISLHTHVLCTITFTYPPEYIVHTIRYFMPSNLVWRIVPPDVTQQHYHKIRTSLQVNILVKTGTANTGHLSSARTSPHDQQHEVIPTSLLCTGESGEHDMHCTQCVCVCV